MNSESDTAAVYRVSFMGSELTEIEMAGLVAAGVAWEGSVNCPDGPLRQRVRVSAIDERHAIAAVRTALGAYIAFGAYTAFTASPVRNSRAEVWRGRVAPTWADIDWQADPRRSRLTEEQRALIGCILDDAEPTWMIASDANVSSDRGKIESALGELEREGMVFSVLAPAFEPGTESHSERWWAVTDVGWDILGLIKSPRYACWTRGVSAS